MEWNPELTLAYLTSATDKYVKQQARDTIDQNVEVEKKYARYARIPDSQACDFCRMLGSRGFVYKTKESAGANNSYHPNCSCQIAVAFDVTQYKYLSNGVHVSRTGSASEQGSANVITSRNGDGSLETYSPEELYDRYLSYANSFTPNKSDMFNRQDAIDRGSSFADSPFQTMTDMYAYVKAATSLEDLQARCSELEKWWNPQIFSDNYWEQLKAAVQIKKRELIGAAA